MIPGISIIVFLKCKDSGIRDTAARFCFGDLLYLGALGPPRGPLEVGVVRLRCPRTLLGPHTNEARRCSDGADAGKTKPVMWLPPPPPPRWSRELRQDTAGMFLLLRVCLTDYQGAEKKKKFF